MWDIKAALDIGADGLLNDPERKAQLCRFLAIGAMVVEATIQFM